MFSLVVLAACGSDEPDRAAAAGERDTATVIDVRTPEEFAAGHLDGAINIDVQAPDFDEKVSELDPAGSYTVYCRSGNRSASAVARMAELGISDVVDAGSLEAAAEHTGLPVVG